MKLIVNVDCLQAPLAGIGQYTQNLVRELCINPQVIDVQGVRATGWIDGERLQQMLQPSHSVAKATNTVESIYPLHMRAMTSLRSLASQIPGARRAKRALQERVALARGSELSDYLYWEPNYNLLPLSNRAMTTVHDLSHIRHPEHHPKERVEILTRYLPDSINRSEKIFTVSEFSRSEVQDHFNIPDDRLVVVSPAASSEYRPYSQSECAAVRTRYALPADYILSVGTLEPRKNLLGLVEAYSRLPDGYRDNYPLVLVGGRGWHTAAIVSALSKLKGHQLINLGYVPQLDLPKIVAAATVLAYPSFYEGFGMPVLEAMAVGTPVLTSNCASMPEVSGGAAVLVEPSRIDDISDGLMRLLDDEVLRQQCSNKGLAAAKRYSWNESAKRLVSAFDAGSVV
jgi:glycosyltransferase involved in cell wall biosynthesis